MNGPTTDAAARELHAGVDPKNERMVPTTSAANTDCSDGVFIRPSADLESKQLDAKSPLGQKAAVTRNLCDYAGTLADSVRGITREIAEELRQTPPVNETVLESGTIEMIRQSLNEEVARESQLRQKLGQLHVAASLLESTVLRNARAQYQCSTGVLDDNPRLSAAICGTLSVLSLAAGIYCAWATHGAVHHFVDGAVHSMLGEGLLASALVYPGVLFALFLEGIPVLASAAIGPVAFGTLKTVVGRIARSSSPTLAERFEAEKESSSHLIEKLHESAQSMLEDLEKIKPLIPNFFRRNETLRKLGSAKIIGLCSDEESKLAQEIRDLNSMLGAGELGTIVRFMNLEKRLNKLKSTDFRSPELQPNTSEQLDRAPQGWKGFFKSSLSFAFGTIRGITGSGHVVGTQTALNAADDLKLNSATLPENLLLDPFSGSGVAIGSTVHLGIETFEKPEKALLDAIKSFAGMASSFVSGEAPEGPSALTLLKVILVADKLETKQGAQKPNVIRWGTEVLFTLALVLFKKPALAFKAQKLEEESGKISPHGIEAELAETHGRAHSAWKSIREIARLSGTIIGGIGFNIGVDLPLRTLSYLDPKLPLAGWIGGRSRSLLLWLDNRRNSVLHNRVEKALNRHPDPEKLRNMDSAELELHALQLSIEYRYDQDTTVTQDEMNSTLAYWVARQNIEWRQLCSRRNIHLDELRALKPGSSVSWRTLLDRSKLTAPLIRLHYFLHPEDSGVESARSVVAEVVSKLRAQSGEKPPQIPVEFMPSFHEIAAELANERKTITVRPTIIDAGHNGNDLIILTTTGQLEVIRGLEGRQVLIGLGCRTSNQGPQGFDILPHADQARIATAELLLSTPLEPPQRRALLAAHYSLSNGEIVVAEATRLLLERSFTVHQLHGKYDDSGRLITPGLFALGIIGDARGN